MAKAWIGCGKHSDEDTGHIGLLELGEEPTYTRLIDLEDPSFLAVHPTLPRLYAISEAEGGLITVETGDERGPRVMRTVPSEGLGPCHVLVHPSGDAVYVAHYGDGTVTAFRLDDDGLPAGEPVLLKHDGTGPNAERQDGAHAHSCIVSPDGNFLVVADLGTDELRAYRLVDAMPVGEVIPTEMSAGMGPRHMVEHDGKLYVAGELSGTVAAVEFDSDGQGRVVGEWASTDRQQADGDPSQLSHILFRDGVILVGGRGPNVISHLKVDGEAVEKHDVATGNWPRHMGFVGDHLVVAAERGDQLVLHPMQGASAGEASVRLDVPTPMCVLPIR